MRKKLSLAEDVERVRRFQAWVKEVRTERKHLTYVEAAANFNRRKNPDEPSIGPTALRRLEDRIDETTTIQRYTCRTVSLALDVPLNEALIVAGHLPDDPAIVLYASLNEAHKAHVQAYIRSEYAEQQGNEQKVDARSSSETNIVRQIELPTGIRQRYTTLPREARLRIHRQVNLEYTTAVRKRRKDFRFSKAHVSA